MKNFILTFIKNYKRLLQHIKNTERNNFFVFGVKAFSFVFLILVVLSACQGDGKSLLPKISGSAGEILVVIDDYKWNSKIGESLKEVLEKEMIGLPAPEPMFNLVKISSGGFANVFKTHRTILIVKVSKEYKKAEILVQRDVYAKPQFIYNLIAPSDSMLLQLILDNKEKLTHQLLVAERDRIIQAYKNTLDKQITDQLREKHKISLVIPKGYTLDMDSSNFLWLSNESPTTSQGIFVYYYNYTDTGQFKTSMLIQKRNQFLKKYVAGPVEGSYMTTEMGYTPQREEYSMRGNYLVELKGLWKLANGGFMGGPFISLTTVDQSTNRIVTIEGFVYAPKADKRNLLRQVEAIAYTLKFPVKDE